MWTVSSGPHYLVTDYSDVIKEQFCVFRVLSATSLAFFFFSHIHIYKTMLIKENEIFWYNYDLRTRWTHQIFKFLNAKQWWHSWSIHYNTHENRRSVSWEVFSLHDDVIKWKYFPRYWPFVRGIHRSLVNSPHKGQWRGALMFSLNCAWINGWVNLRGWCFETPSRPLWRHRKVSGACLCAPRSCLISCCKWARPIHYYRQTSNIRSPNSKI